MLSIQTENKGVMQENAKIVREKDMIENERDQIELSRTQCETTNAVSSTIEPPTIDFTLTIATAVVGGILALLLAITLFREVMEKNRIAAKLTELENLPKTRCVLVYLLSV